MNCPSCGYYNPSGAQTCFHCGLLLPLASGSDARCARHPDLVAAGACSRCGTFGCGQCLTPQGTQWLCPPCSERHALLPWDEREALGLWRAWWQTSIRIISAPSQTLQGARPDAPMGSSALYAAMCVLVGVVPFFLVMAGFAALGALVGKRSGEGAEPLTLLGIVVGELFCGTVMQFAFVFLFAAFEHLALLLVGAQPKSFDVTLRATALSHGVYLVGLVPVCGLYVAPVWALVIRIIAYMHLHRTTAGKAAAGALLPMVLFCGLGLAAWAVFFGVVSSIRG